jgi:dTDP-glucose pyrophosphorylase/CBS domain-containing protein
VNKNILKNTHLSHYSQWRDAILTLDKTIADALKNINKSGSKISLIVNNKGEFQGTISDGDIRRALINGKDQKTPIQEIVNINALTVTPEIEPEIVLQIMVKNKVQQIPVVDESQKVAGLFLWDEVMLQKKFSNIMVIMAGGKGSRLSKYTKNCPKPLLPVGGKPMLERIIERAKSQGFERFLISINYLGHMIENYFSNGKKWKVDIDYIKEDKPLGTAGALGLISSKPKLPIIVSNCDIVSDFHFTELLNFHYEHNAEATMAVRLHEWENPYGVIQTKGVDIVDIEEKPIVRSHINAGVYILEPSTIDLINKNENLDMPDLFKRIKQKNLRTIVYPMYEPWLDIGRPEDYYKAK